MLLSRGCVEAGTAEASPILVDFDGGLVGDGGPVLVDSGFVGEVEADDEGRGDDAPRCAHQWHLHVRGRDGVAEEEDKDEKKKGKKKGNTRTCSVA